MQPFLTKKEERKKWIEYIQNIKFSVEKILLSKKSVKKTEKILSTWMKARVVSLYFEHVVVDNNPESSIVKLIPGIWAVNFSNFFL